MLSWVELMQEIHKLGKPTVVVLLSGTMGLCLFLTFSRGSFVGLGAALAVWLRQPEDARDAALAEGIEIEHACEKSCACTTCHVIVREGYDSLEEPDELEDDYLDKAWGLEPDSRLSCQAIVTDEDLVIEIPKYTINMVSEQH